MKKRDGLSELEIQQKSKGYRNPSWYNVVHGINYIASYCRNSYEMWKNYECETIERELGYAKKVNFDSIRIYLNYRAWSEDPTDFIINFRHFLKTSSELALLVNPTIFDGCGVEDADITEKITIVGNLYEKASPSLRMFISRGYGKKYVKKYLWNRIIPDLKNEWVLAWEFRAPTPGPSRMGEDYWPLYEKYCIDLIKAANIDNVILAWDVMNEPFHNPENFLLVNEHIEPIKLFFYHFIDFMQKRVWEVPIMVGVGYQNLPQIGSKCDILCFHCYEDPPLLQNVLNDVKISARKLNKPILCNECLSYFLYHERPDEQTQLEKIKQQYEIFDRENIGWMAWHLTKGEMFLSYCGFIRRDGSLKPAAQYLKNRIHRFSEY